ncbi:MAG TPA: hypothetical protein PKD91_11970 [Bacteroidia bacterium]|nr:hypothetical protein [Bacteroidia bacterium]
MENGDSSYNLILKSLSEKATAKIEVVKKATDAFNTMKTVLKQLELQLQSALANLDNRIIIKYSERGPFDLEFKISDDVIIISLHTDAFTFPESHPIWKNSYMKGQNQKAYFGMISIYNFLTDSLKYNRTNDIGILIARIFVNFENHFFVEGKKQLGFLYNDLENDLFTEKRIRDLLESAIIHSLNSDIYTPPFDQVKVISVQELMDKNLSTILSTGKRLGFKLQSDTDIQ